MLRSGERTHRSAPHLLSRRAQCSGHCLADLDMDSFFSLWDGGFHSVPVQRLRSHILFLFVFTPLCSRWLDGTLSRALLSDFGSPGQVDRVSSGIPGAAQPWSSFTSFSRVTPLSLVLPHSASQSSPVSSSSLSQSSVLTPQSSLVPSSSLRQPSLSLDTGSSHRQYVHRPRCPSRGAASRRFSPGPLKRPLVRMRPRGYTPHGYSGALGEWCERRFGAHQVFFNVPVVSIVRYNPREG